MVAGRRVHPVSKPSKRYLKKPFSGADKLRLAKANSTLSAPAGTVKLGAGLRDAESKLTGCSSIRAASITTGGGLVLVCKRTGSSSTKPLMVGKHRVPWRRRQAPGCEPELHSLLGSPSDLPNVRQVTSPAGCRAKSSRLCLVSRIRPELEPTHRLPFPSSTIYPILLLASPSRVE